MFIISKVLYLLICGKKKRGEGVEWNKMPFKVNTMYGAAHKISVLTWVKVPPLGHDPGNRIKIPSDMFCIFHLCEHTQSLV